MEKKMGQQVGLIGLGVMGSNLALNIERNGFPIAVYNRNTAKATAFMDANPGKQLKMSDSLQGFIDLIDRPRKIILMVSAGAAVDAVIKDLRPMLDDGDIIIDAGNSHFQDTERRVDELADTKLRYIGMGVSGGEEGALWGPSIMPGGNENAYKEIEEIVTKISAKSDTGDCAAFVGKRSAGHFVKMCHNGIEYGDMQLIAETYDLMRHVFNLSPKQIAEIFNEWNQSELQSYLIEITAEIIDFADDQDSGDVLIDRILDIAGQKGTGKWVSQTALDLGVPIPTITASVDARFMSALKNERIEAAKVYPQISVKVDMNAEDAIPLLKNALYASKICSYAQGFALMKAASDEYNYDLQMHELARIWKGGCIIRAVFLDLIRKAYVDNPSLSNLLMAPEFQKDIEQRISAWRSVVSLATNLGIALPAMSASLAYFDNYRRERNPANIIQAQRDYFGAHTYQRTDKEGIFHTQWITE
jgi:6-phosphogluconate dehydrogenase